MENQISVRELRSSFLDATFEVDREKASLNQLVIPENWRPTYEDPEKAFLFLRDGTPWKSLSRVAKIMPLEINLDKQMLSDFAVESAEVELTSQYWNDANLGLIPLRRVVVRYKTEVVVHSGKNLGDAIGNAIVQKLIAGEIRPCNPLGGPIDIPTFGDYETLETFSY